MGSIRNYTLHLIPKADLTSQVPDLAPEVLQNLSGHEGGC